MAINKKLETSLSWLSRNAPRDQLWWIIGSSAAYLLGADFTPEDVDVVASAEVIAMMTGISSNGRREQSESWFHSDPFFRLEVDDGLPIEFMGDLTFGHEGARTPLRIETRQAIKLTSGIVYVPEIKEQITIFEIFGRPKDLQKAKILKAFLR